MQSLTSLCHAATRVVAGAAFVAGTALAAEPTDLHVAIILSAGIENGWDGSLIEAFERVAAEDPHGLDISWRYSDPLWGDAAGEAMRLYAESGQFDIIWAHSTYSDQVARLKDEFPEILFVVVGSGNEGLGGNQYWVYKRVHEAGYLLGALAGHITESNVLGAIGTFPADDVNDEINAFFAGARSVNPDVTGNTSFIESWYDPAKAGEFTAAKVATGADIIFQLAANFKPCEEAQILCLGNFGDQHSFSPDTVLSSALAIWDPDIRWIVDEWWAFKTEGAPLEGNTDLHWFSMAEGGADIAPFHGLSDRVPEDVKAEIDTLRASIMDGSFAVPLDVSPPES